MTLILGTAELSLQTRRKTSISNRLDRSAAAEGLKQAVKDYVKTFRSALHKTDVGPCATFNCHGLTFGSRRTWIDGTAQIQQILDEDDYVMVSSLKQVLPGDIAIYKNNGTIEHSGIVVERGEGLTPPKILSKWGNLHEVVHLPMDCPYQDMIVTYYRITI